MSNDVSGGSTSSNPSDSSSVPPKTTVVQVVSQEESNANQVPVPVEVVVEGQVEPENVVADSVEETPKVQAGLFVDSLSIDPAEEVAILLGEKPKQKPTVEVEAETPVEPTEVPVASSTSAVEDPFLATEDLESPKETVVVPESVEQETETVVAPEAVAAPETVAAPEAVAAPEPVVEPKESRNLFEEMGLGPAVLKAIKKVGYETPSPIQAQAVPVILSGRDLMGQAETGSGKTAAFAWPLLSRIDMSQNRPQVLVLAPTRELAIQVTAAFEKYATGIENFRAVTIYGGQSYETQLRALNRGVQVVVGTPGRVMDHLRRKTLDLRNLKTLVLDEADEMLRMGFIDDVEWILEQLPRERQILSFSATLPPPIQRIAKNYLQNPAHIAIKSKTATAESIAQTCVFVSAREKLERLVRILETEESDGVIIFVKTRNSTIVVSEGLVQRGIIASPLNGDIPQAQRERTVNQLKSGRINVVVATDVAARGLDVQRISHVINYDFPHDTEAYVHRIGRTGRAGRNGNAILFVEPKEKGKLSRLQRATNQRIETFKPKSIDEINQIRIGNFKEQVVKASSHGDVKFFTQLVNELKDDSELSIEQIAASLGVMAQGQIPLLLKELKDRKTNRKKDAGRERGPMTLYRIEVGREHGVGPGNIVGAITNEADLNNDQIGRINIFDKFSTILLPSELNADVINHLKHVYVSGQALGISKSDQKYSRPAGGRGAGGSQARGNRSDKRFGDKRFGDKRSGDKRFGDKRGNGKRFERGPGRPKVHHEGASEGRGRDYDRKSPERTAPDRTASARTAPDRTASARKTTVSENRKPFSEGSVRKKFSDKKPTKKKSNATVQRTERGEKKDRFSRDEGSKYSGQKSSFDKGRSKPAKKSKAATRVQAKRKAGAKPSSPMKKYVKIR